MSGWSTTDSGLWIPHGNTVVVGLQYGDEGKGKIIDYLSEYFDIVARYQGGANAGHTSQVGDDVIITHLIPSGFRYPHTLLLFGNGGVLDPNVFHNEYVSIEETGVDLSGRFKLDRRAHLDLPHHIWLDAFEESKRKSKIGTTLRGIGPTYQDKAGRHGIRAVYLKYPEIFTEKLAQRVEYLFDRYPEIARPEFAESLNARVDELRKRGKDTSSLELTPDMSPEYIASVILARSKRFLGDDFSGLVDGTSIILDGIAQGKRVLWESAQATALDLDHGTYPNCTSSNPTAGFAATGTGVGPKNIHYVNGVAKAYDTRVGSGVFVTQLEPEEEEHIRRLGGEFGATTGRPRKCGWHDAVQTRRGVRLNGVDELSITKLDVLDSLPEFKVCVQYELDGERLPVDLWPDDVQIERVKPVYETLPGWQTSTRGVRRISDLPYNARKSIGRIEEIAEVPARFVTVGPEREQLAVAD